MALRPPRPQHRGSTAGVVAKPGDRCNLSPSTGFGDQPESSSTRFDRASKQRDSRSRSHSGDAVASASDFTAPRSEDIGLLVVASAEELRERLVGIQRRLAKEGVRAAALDSALREERGRSSELAAELSAARAVPRGRLPFPRAKEHGDSQLPDGDVELQTEKMQQECCQLREELKARADRQIEIEKQLEAATNEQHAAHAQIEQVELSGEELSARHLAVELDECEKRFERIAGERVAKQYADLMTTKEALIACERRAGEALIASEFEEREQRAELMIAVLHARVDNFRQQVADANMQCEQRLQVASAELRSACDHRLRGARERWASELADHVEHVESEASLHSERIMSEELRDQAARMEQTFNDRETAGRLRENALHSELQEELEVVEARHAAAHEELLKAQDARNAQISEHLAHLVEVNRLQEELSTLSSHVQQLEERSAASARALEEQSIAHHHAAEAAALAASHVAQMLSTELVVAQERATELEVQVEERSRMKLQEILDKQVADFAAQMCMHELHEERLAQELATSVLQRRATESRQEQLESELVQCHADMEGRHLQASTEDQVAEVVHPTSVPEGPSGRLAGKAATLRAQLREQLAQLARREAALDEAHRMLQQLQAELDEAREELRQIRAGFPGAGGGGSVSALPLGVRAAGAAPCEGPGQLEEMQHLLELAHEENRTLHEQIAQQADEISLLEGQVLASLNDLRDEGNTGRRWGAGAGGGQRRGGSLLPGKVGPSPSLGPVGRATPPRRPGEVRKVLPQASSGFAKIAG